MAAFLERLKNRLAELAVGPSTLRNVGPAGLVAVARRGLRAIDLRSFVVPAEAAFSSRLDEATAALLDAFLVAFPERGNIWGAARKVLNLFLRDAVYSSDLSGHFDLQRIRPWLELPLDSHAAKGLAGEPEGRTLGKWPRIKYLTAGVSASYQRVAAAVAKRRGVARVDLDVFYWRAERESPTPLPEPLSAPADESRDEWERGLREIAIDCGVSLSDDALSREGLYE